MRDDLILVAQMLGFAFLIITLAEWNYRREMRRLCLCCHPRREHNIYLGKCTRKELIGGLLYRCSCSEYRDAAQVSS